MFGDVIMYIIMCALYICMCFSHNTSLHDKCMLLYIDDIISLMNSRLIRNSLVAIFTAIHYCTLEYIIIRCYSNIIIILKYQRTVVTM